MSSMSSFKSSTTFSLNYSAIQLVILFVAVGPMMTPTTVSAEFGSPIYETADDYTQANITITYRDPNTGLMVTERDDAIKYFISRVAKVDGILVPVTSSGGREGPTAAPKHDACQPIDGDNFPAEPWIALAVYGSNCKDSVKFKNLANTNASAAIFYNSKSGFRFVKVQKSNLVSVLITKERGDALGRLLANGTRIMVQIGVGNQLASRYANINKTSVLFVSISFIVLMIISLAWLIFYYVQRFRYIHAKDILARRLSTAAKKAMDKIPTKTIRPADLENIFDSELAECCAVCIESFKTSDVVRILPCKHLFHKSCVDPWLIDNRSCPMCKMDILKFYGLVYANSQESVINIDDLDTNWSQRRQRSNSDDVEVVHVPMPNNNY